MSKTQKKILLIFVCLFLIGMFVMSGGTSPLTPYACSGDSAIFYLLGKGMANGKMLYVDLFDHKGPILFFIEMIGYIIGGRTGIFVLQCIFGCVNLSFLYKIWENTREEESKRPMLDLFFVFISTCAAFFFTFEGGNLSEEYSLPFISISLYLLTKYAINTKQDDNHPYSYSFCYGICFGIIAFIRLNNAVTIASGVLVIIIYLLFKKKYKNLLGNILFGLLGVLVIAVPVCLYFEMNSALYEMIYATFIYNFKYMGSLGYDALAKYPFKYVVLYMPMFVSLVLITMKWTKREGKEKLELIDMMSYCIVIFNLLSLVISNSFAHYFAIYVPVFAFVTSRYWTFKKKDIKTILILLCLLGNLFYAARSFGVLIRDNFVTKEHFRRYKVVEHTVDVIPENEKDSVIAYNLHARYYVLADIIPCYKYYTYQEWWSVNNPAIKEDFMQWFKEDRPLWVMIHTKESDKELRNILENNYELKKENILLSVYRLKE